MKRALGTCLAAGALVAGAFFAHAAAASGAGGHGHRHRGHGAMGDHATFLTGALGLDAEQQASLKKLHEEIAQAAKPLHEEHRRQMEEVHALLEAANTDPAEIGRKVIAAHATRDQLKSRHDDFAARLSALLTPEQLEKLEALRARHAEQGMHGMHGMHGGFGGFGHPGPESAH